jgi:S1-C subfamily serine protease
MNDRPRHHPIAIVTVVVAIGGLAAGGVAVAIDRGHNAAYASQGASPLVDGGGSGFPSALGPAIGHALGGAAQPSSSPPRQRSSSTLANPAEQVGVVDIDTTLTYAGARGAGTGMVLTPGGEVLTNNHVVENATRIDVTVVSTGRSYQARVVGTDAVDDVAVLMLQGASGLRTVTTDATRPVLVGDPVTGVGNAGGAGATPTAAPGTVASLVTSIHTQTEFGVRGERLTGLIEVDAAIVSGDSGGPLYDADTVVIGMDTAASTGTRNVRGFAIPIGKALRVAARIEAGRAAGGIILGYPAFLGVQVRDTLATSGGASVFAVVNGTPAARAGIASGDVITRVGTHRVESASDLTSIVQSFSPGTAVRVAWTDGVGLTHIARLTLVEGPPA